MSELQNRHAGRFAMEAHAGVAHEESAQLVRVVFVA